MDLPAGWTMVKKQVQSDVEIAPIKLALRKVSHLEIVTSYEDGMNLLHLAITKNRKDVLGYIFEKYSCLPPSATVPYIHAACAHGCLDIAKLLLDQRPEERFAVVLEDDQYWKLFSAARCCSEDRNVNLHMKIVQCTNQKKYVSALDVASLYQQEECLALLLEDIPPEEMLAKMVEREEAAALCMLLATKKFSADALNGAFEMSLYTMSTACLEVLLQFAAEKKVAFQQANPYHFLYMFGNWLKGGSAGECTRILINYGYDVNSTHKPATFPLYTLLWVHIFDPSGSCGYCVREHEPIMRAEVFTCLSELLKAGANPNFDEETSVKSELDKRRTRSGSRKLESAENNLSTFEANLVHENREFERKEFSSAMECIMTRIFRSFSLNELYLEITSQFVKLLAEYGCKISFVDKSGDSLLRRILRGLPGYVVRYYGKSEVSRVIGLAIGTVLEHGGDLQVRDNYGRLPFTYFSEKLIYEIEPMSYVLRRDEAVREALCQRIEAVYSYLRVMEMDAAKDAVAASSKTINMALRDQMLPKIVGDRLKRRMYSYIQSVKSLYHICLVKVWRQNDCKLAKLGDLRIPGHIQQDLRNMLYQPIRFK